MNMPTLEELALEYYKKNPVRRNDFSLQNQKPLDGFQRAALNKGIFALEGPESVGTFVQIPKGAPGKTAIDTLADNLYFNNPDGLEEYLDNISKRVLEDGGLSIPVEGLDLDEGGFFGGGGPFVSGSGQQFNFKSEEEQDIERQLALRAIQDAAVEPRFDQGFGTGGKRQEKILENEAARIIAMPDDSSVFDESGLDEIGALLNSLDATVNTSGPPIRNVSDSSSTVEERKMRSQPVIKPPYIKSEEQGIQDVKVTQENVDDAFMAALKDAGLGGSSSKQESKADALARYKKEFQDATGIDASGKVDKSRALMAFGLALIQNKAGKKFNIRKILNSVGEAGEAAMPALDKATAEAKASQIAAGKYALQQRRADIDAKLAAAKSDQDFKKKRYFKWYDSKLKREEENLKAQAELLKAKVEGGEEYDKKHEFTFATGQGDASSWKIPVIYDKKNPTGGIILKPEAYARKYIDGRGGVEDAIEIISVMRDAAFQIKKGGGTTKFAFDKLNSIGKAIFPDLNTGQPSSEQEYAQGVNMLMGRFKRFLTQETGNGISNRDVEIWENEIMKKPGWFTNYDETSSALDQLEDIFRSKLSEFDAGLDFIYNPENLNKGDFKKLVEKYGDLDQIQGATGKLIFKDGKIVRAN